MPDSAPTTVNPREILATLRTHAWLWSVPAGVAALLATAYAVMRPDTWKASQALLVRDEAAGSLSRQGRFDNTDAMKTAQETILEMATSRAVVHASLETVGPDPSAPAKPDWPTAE